MDHTGSIVGKTKSLAERWFAVGGGSDRDGNLITQPPELGTAIMIDGLAQRYGCTPSQIMREPVSVLPIVELATMAEADKIKKQEAKMKSASKGK